MPHDQLPTVAIVGLGLIGGSLALRLRERGYDVRGYARSGSTRAEAARAGIPVYDDRAQMLESLPPRSIVVLAAPLPAVLQMLPEVASETPADATITDVVSVKSPLRDAAAHAGISERFVGAHPMAGTAYSGFSAAFPELLDDAPWVLTLDEGTDLQRWLVLAELIIATGGFVVPTDSASHDAAVAWTSHLPHVLAELLAAPVAVHSLRGALAAGSFRDATRVAGTRPELVDAMLLGNQAALSTALDEYAAQLAAAAAALRSGEPRTVTEPGFASRTAWQDTDRSAYPQRQLDCSGPAAAAALRAVGQRGGRVVSADAITRTALVCDPANDAQPQAATGLRQE